MLKKTLSLHCESLYNLNMEKMRKTILLMFLTLLFFACKNHNDKNKTSTKSTDTVFVKEFSVFNINDIGKIDTVNQYSKINIQNFASGNLDELLSRKEVTCLIFWASWCKGCNRMLDLAYRDVIEKYRKTTTFAIISISDDLKETQIELFKLKYFIQTYALDTSINKSTEETNDWSIFESYLRDQFKNESFEIRVPYILVLNKNKKIISKDPDYIDLDKLLSKITK
jgi:thiol-disulfide isomerase/thioredoxin